MTYQPRGTNENLLLCKRVDGVNEGGSQRDIVHRSPHTPCTTVTSITHTIFNAISETITLLDRESRVRPQIPATRADIETILASSDSPLLRGNVPVTEIALAESKRGGLSAAGCDGHLLEAAELTDGFVRDGGEGDVELSDLGTVSRTGVPSWPKTSASPSYYEVK